MKLFDQLLNILAQYGVREVFGVPGDAINPLIEAIRKQDSIRFIHVVHEETGALAASAQAKLTGGLAVCAGTVGPGAIHLLNGLYDAKKDRAPVLAITGQVPSVEQGFGYHQEVDLDSLFQDVAEYQVSIQNPDQMPRAAIEACSIAMTKKDVAVLTIPQDIGLQSVETEEISTVKANRYNTNPAESELRQAVEMIDKAKRIAILYGEGCRESRESLLALARHLGAPLVPSLKAKDIIPYAHDMVAGGIGLLGSRGGVTAMDDCDLLLTLGSDFPYREWYPRDVPIIHVDADPSAIGKRMAGEFGLIGDCSRIIPQLLEGVRAKTDVHFLESVRKSKKLWDRGMAYLASTERSRDTIHPQALARTLSDAARENAIITCDTGTVTVWGARHFHTRAGQRFTCSFNLASMAYALPAAIGAQLKYPDRQVISLSGDGGFNMLMGDLLTAVKYALPVKVIIFNNKKLGLIKMEQEVEGYPEHETDLLNPDYAALAQSFGAQGATVTSPAALTQGVDRALASTGPYLLDVHVHSEELTIPPRIELAQAWGFTKAKAKEVFSDLFAENQATKI